MSAVRRRVLIIGPTPPPYHGVATFTRDLLQAASLFRTFLLDPLDTSDRRDASNLGRWDAGNLSLGFANLAEMASRLGRKRHDLVYIPISQNIPAFLRDALFIAQARLFGARVVLHLHGGYFREFFEKETPAWFRAVSRRVLKQAAAVVVLSPEFKPIFDGLVEPRRVHVVENGVPDLFAGLATSELPRNHTLLYMSTLARSKGIVDLVRALPKIRNVVPDVRLRIAGNWSESDTHDEVQAYIVRENLDSYVEFVGSVDGAAKTQFLRSGCIFCLPTHYRYEGQPLVILEAMSAALPVLSTHHGAIGSTVQDKVTGRLLDAACSPEDLATVLCGMLADPETLQRQSVKARQRYLECFTLEHCHNRLAQVFEDALQ